MKLKGIRLSVGASITLGTSILISLLSSCHSQPSSAELVNQVKNLGVYASTGAAPIEITNYGIKLEDAPVFRFKDPIPKVPSVAYFVVNIPNINIMESHLYSFSDPRKIQFATAWMEHRLPELKANVEAIGSAVYKMTLVEKPRGRSFVILWLKMSIGSQNRLYTVELSE